MAGSQAVSAIIAQRTIPASGGEHRGARRAETIEQRAANQEEHNDLGRDRQ